MVSCSIFDIQKKTKNIRRISNYERTELENSSDFTKNKKKQPKPICNNEPNCITTSNERFKRFIV